MIYTIKQTKKATLLKKTIICLCVALFWTAVWEIASRLVSRDNTLLLFIFPAPSMVFKKWVEMLSTLPYYQTVLFSFLRIFAGFVLGVFAGFVLGVLTHISKFVYYIFSPILKIIRTIPVVAIIILLYLFLKSDILPIWIVFLMVVPIVWQTVNDSLNNTDTALLEMAFVYKLSKPKVLFAVKLPQIAPSFITVCVNALGLAWKSGIAAEVLCLPEISIGTMMWQSKGYVNYDEVYALTFTVIILSALTEFLLKFLCKKYLPNNGGNKND